MHLLVWVYCRQYKYKGDYIQTFFWKGHWLRVISHICNKGMGSPLLVVCMLLLGKKVLLLVGITH